MQLNFKSILEAEYKSAKSSLKPQSEIVRLSRKSSKRFGLELQRFLEMVIMVKGHAWCMDVKSERRKMSKLVTKSILELL